jgi:hypothetical protein
MQREARNAQLEVSLAIDFGGARRHQHADQHRFLSEFDHDARSGVACARDQRRIDAVIDRDPRLGAAGADTRATCI